MKFPIAFRLFARPRIAPLAVTSFLVAATILPAQPGPGTPGAPGIDDPPISVPAYPVTGAATLVTHNSATLNGSYNFGPDVVPPAKVGFVFGTDPGVRRRSQNSPA